MKKEKSKMAKNLEKLNKNRNVINCPRCSTLFKKLKMRLIKHSSGAILDVCDYCGGMWLDGDEVKLLYDYKASKLSNKNKK